jgi:hypothetical protein
MLSDRRLGGIEGATDSEVLFGLALDRMDAGAGPGAALTSVIHTVAGVAGGRMNLVLTDGHRFAATTWGDSLFVCEGGSLGAGARIVASEPFDDDPAWRPVPDRSVVEAGPEGIRVVAIEGMEHPARPAGNAVSNEAVPTGAAAEDPPAAAAAGSTATGEAIEEGGTA